MTVKLIRDVRWPSKQTFPSVFGEWVQLQGRCLRVQLQHVFQKVCAGTKCVPIRDVLKGKKANKGVDRSHMPDSLHYLTNKEA